MNKRNLSRTRDVAEDQSFSRDEWMERMDKALADIPEASRAGARFETVIFREQWDESSYCKMVMNFESPEGDAEQSELEAKSASGLAELERRERAELARLAEKFDQTIKNG